MKPVKNLTTLLFFSLLISAILPAGMPVLASSQDAPVPASVSPASAPNNAAATITIEGSGFQPGLFVRLGSTFLEVLEVEDPGGTWLKARVPWGLSAGTYSLMVVNPDDSMGTLQDAFQVVSAIGQFSNKGPFGGQIWDIHHRPGDPATLYAMVHEAGLFVSHDSGETWSMLLANSFPMELQISPVDPDVMYLNSTRAVEVTTDGGLSWSSIQPAGNSTLAAYPDPLEVAAVYILEGPNLHNYTEPGANQGSLKRSTNYGAASPAWEVIKDALDFTSLAYSPDFATDHTLLAGTQDGKIYKYIATEGWLATPLADVCTLGGRDCVHGAAPRVAQIAFNPQSPGEAWAVVRNPFSQTDSPVIYRGSLTGSWAPVNLGSAVPQRSWMNPWSLSFGANRIYLAYSQGFTSPNQASPAWQAFNENSLPEGIPEETWRDFEFTYLTENPSNANEIYGGSVNRGIFKSSNGGATWQPANQGIAGIIPYSLAVSPHDLDLVYAATQANGVMKSVDGGQNWEMLGFRRGGYPWRQTSMAVDRHTPATVYIGQACSGAPQSGTQDADACVKVSQDGGGNWDEPYLPAPAAPAGGGKWHYGESYAVASDPSNPGRVLAAGTFYPWSMGNDPNNRDGIGGALYYSVDSGATWHLAASPSGVSPEELNVINQFSFGPEGSGLVYAAGATGILRSGDSGTSWQQVTVPGCPAAPDPNQSRFSVELNPRRAGEIFAGCDAGLFHTSDGGETWTQVTRPDGGLDELEIHNLPEPMDMRLYASGWQGVQVSRDGGMSWEYLPGVPVGACYVLGGGVEADREVVYASTSSGMSSPAASAALSMRQTDSSRLMSGGLYGATFAFRRGFLPLVRR